MLRTSRTDSTGAGIMSTNQSSRDLGVTSGEVLRTQQFSAVEPQAGCSGKLGSPGLGQKPQDWGRRKTPPHVPFLRLSAIYQAAVKMICKSQTSFCCYFFLVSLFSQHPWALYPALSSNELPCTCKLWFWQAFMLKLRCFGAFCPEKLCPHFVRFIAGIEVTIRELSN